MQTTPGIRGGKSNPNCRGHWAENSIGHQIGQEQGTATATDLGGAPGKKSWPRNRGPGRENAAQRRVLWRGKIWGAALEWAISDL